MNLPVVWEPDAVADIDAALEASSDATGREIVGAIEEIARTLSLVPLQVGESRLNGLTRVFIQSPIAVHYRVVDRIGLVRVLAARVHRPPQG